MKSTPRPFRRIITRTGAARVAVGLSLLLVAGPLALASAGAASAAAPAPGSAAFVNLGSAANYSVLAGTSVANTGAGTVLALDLGVSPTGTIAGFPPGTVTGTTHTNDVAAETAQSDRQTAYDAAVAQTGGTAFAGDQAGKTYTPGLYTTAAAITNTGTITLDAQGDSSAVFVFQIGAALSSAAATKVVLTGGALANNVFWQVVGAISLGANAKFVGTFLAAGVVAFGDGASLKGRILTPGSVALSNSPVTKPIDDLTPPLVTINGGAARSSNDTTPSISGTTDEPGHPIVTVTVGAQALTATVNAGAWSLSTDALTEGAHTVVASVTDPSQNTGTATQTLTVDTVAPVVAITGGPATATPDPTPTISGTTDAPAATPVSVTVAGQTLATTVGAAGAWSVDAATLTEAAHGVTASVVDAAQNTGVATQILTVDYTVPVVTIDGGSTRSTTDTSPWTYGTTAEQAGTIVNLSVGGQQLTATVHPGGTWGVSAETLANGSYKVTASVTDAAQNTGTATQTLRIGTVKTPGPPPADPPVYPASRYKPDAEIRALPGGFVGAGRYGDTGQRVSKKLGHKAHSALFEVQVTNRGDVGDKMDILGTPTSSTFKVTYRAGGKDVTADVEAGTYRTDSLKPGESMQLMVKITKVKHAEKGSKGYFAIRASSSHELISQDTVAAQVRIGG